MLQHSEANAGDISAQGTTPLSSDHVRSLYDVEYSEGNRKGAEEDTIFCFESFLDYCSGKYQLYTACSSDLPAYAVPSSVCCGILIKRP